eukprot:Opistho-2@5008
MAPAPTQSSSSSYRNGGNAGSTRSSSELQKEPTILFNASKDELCTVSNGFKFLHRRLRTNWKITKNREEISYERLAEANVVVFGGPREKFTAAEFDSIKRYVENGGSLLLTLGEGGEGAFNTNINFLLEEYGIMVNSDAVVRTVFYKYFHPKEVYINNGVLNREVNRAAGKRTAPEAFQGANPQQEESHVSSVAYVYPYGATLDVQKPAIPILSTGNVSFPLNQPTCAFYASPPSSKGRRGKVAVIGNTLMLSDTYIDKEENAKIQDVVFQWLTSDKVQLNSIDAEDPDVNDYHFLPETAALSERLRSCLQESEEIPKDFSQLFNHSLYKLDTSVIPDAVKAFEHLRIKHEPLTLITPQFETPLPPLQPAVFPPTFRELPPPSLDLFDLDEQFSSERVRLAQITNKCNDDDLEYYVRECGEILGVAQKLPSESRDGKHLLEYIFRQLVDFKKFNQD